MAHEISLIRKGRTWYSNVIVGTAIFSALSFFLIIYLKDYSFYPFDREINIEGICFGALLVSLLALKIPFKRHIENGTITFHDDQLSIEIHNKTERLNIEDVSSITMNIQGFYGQDYFNPKELLPIENGTNNFLVIKHKREKRELELYLSSKEDLAILKKYINHYGERTNVSIHETH